MDLLKIIIPISVLVTTALLALIGALKGRKRGIKRQAVRTGTIILSIVLSLVIVKAIYGATLGFFDEPDTAAVIAKLEKYKINFSDEVKKTLSNFDPVVLEYISAIPLAIVLGPLIFVPTFIVVSGIMWIVHAIICGIAGFKKKKNSGLTRLFGMLLGLFQGLLVAVVLMVPAVGITSTLSTTIDSIRQKEEISEAESNLVKTYDENFSEIVENPTFKIFGACGGKLIYNTLSTVKVDGNRVQMGNEIENFVALYNEFGSIKSEFTALTPEEQASFRKIIDTINGSDYLAPLLSATVNGVGSMLEGSVAAGEETPTKALMTDVVAIFKTSTQNTVKEDIETLSNFLFLLINDGVFKASDSENTDALNIADVLIKPDANGETTVDRAITILNSNPRTKHLVQSLIKISVVYAKQTLAENFSSAGIDPEKIDEIYNEVKGGVNKIVATNSEEYASEEERKEAVSDAVEQMVKENGFITDEEISANQETMDKVFDEVADHVIKNFGDKEEVDDTELMGLIVQYYNSYNQQKDN